MTKNTNAIWIKTASNHAVISKQELLEWLDINPAQLKTITDRDGFPQARMGGFGGRPTSNRITSTSRWRVGDVRAWLANNVVSFHHEMAQPIAAERRKSSTSNFNPPIGKATRRS